MFTPPDSPLPTADASNDLSVKQLATQSFPLPVETPKRRIGRRTKWTAVLIPLILTLITLSTKYITHPAAFDILSRKVHDPTSQESYWKIHKRHPDSSEVVSVATTASALLVSSSSAASVPTSTSSPTSASSDAVPTIPTNATLPTPFPQPWDSDIGQNYSSMTCLNFFSNMTNTAAFRSCRPLSLLLMSSSDLVDAQTNLTELNAIIWGTCNTTLGKDTCVSNMSWFASSLQSQCSQDIEDGNDRAINALLGLQTYSLMYDAGCLANPSTDSYCYVESAYNSNPSDLYLYQLAQGIAMPNTTTPTCSACGQSLLSLYLNSLQSTPTLSSSFRESYDSAATLTSSSCGANYAQVLATSNGSSAPRTSFFFIFLVALWSFSTLA